MIYKIFTVFGEDLIEEQDLPVTDARRSANPLFVITTLLIIETIFFTLAFISHAKYFFFKSDAAAQWDDFLDHQVKMVFWEAIEGKYDEANADISHSFEILDIARGEVPFMKEVLRSYAYREKQLRKDAPRLEWKISVLAATPEHSELRNSSAVDLIRRNKQEVFFSDLMMKHLEMMDMNHSSKDK